MKQTVTVIKSRDSHIWRTGGNIWDHASPQPCNRVYLYLMWNISTALDIKHRQNSHLHDSSVLLMHSNRRSFFFFFCHTQNWNVFHFANSQFPCLWPTEWWKNLSRPENFVDRGFSQAFQVHSLNCMFGFSSSVWQLHPATWPSPPAGSDELTALLFSSYELWLSYSETTYTHQLL